ncbi:flagellar hook-length control protein FliK [Paenibacillus chondroitinus]|uniref:Flagellar hook-length control protein FliK n=1 Tax=Paenibacillus chondroitinus TaxID=59842 RepID=A0ABU6DFT7_9BACL|nr:MULTISPECIES: flagellar hook-length control protein FliK [Paenibacillus]MCY9659034.1 flagellar hook-length control protein FliK [Paenibacillus anseongense]MEB4796631.1 flagellar hook-length control protein FliK [Paenibacillus chondroitinus]
MDVQIQTTPTANSASTSTNKAGAAATAGTTSKDGFNQVLDGQLSQDSTAKTETNPADPALSLDMLLQMLQSLVAPLKGTAAQDVKTEDQPLSEVVLEAMNSNPALAQQLLQDPKVQQWFEEAEQLLQTLSGAQLTPLATLPSTLKLQTTEVSSLQAQNTLLALASLSKQQPDNPIVKFLNQDLQNVIQPLLPELMTNLKGQTLDAATTESAVEAMEGLMNTGKKEVTSTDKPAHHKLNSKKTSDQNVDMMNTVTIAQPAKSKLELLALKSGFLTAQVDASSKPGDTLPNLVDLPTEPETATNSVVTIADLQRTQQTQAIVAKTVAPTMNAANFADEMTEHVLKNMKITLADGFSEAKLSLFPKNLGHIDVKISMHDGQLIAQFAAESAAAKQLLENQLPQLRQALLTQGLQVEKLEVTQSQNMQSSMFQEHRQQQAFAQPQRQNKNNSGGFEVDSLDLEQEIDANVQVKPAMHGNSFDVTA